MHNSLEIIFILICGLCFGSFITMASYRFALDDKRIFDLMCGRSFCIKCNKKLKIKNLIPFFSWIFQKGKCSFCHDKISIRYPLIEVLSMTIFLITYFACGQIIDLRMILILLMAVLLMIMVVTDLEHYFIPDSTQIILSILILIYHLVNHDGNIFYYLGSGVLFIIFGLSLDYGFLIFTGKKAIGIDDIKFFGNAGWLLGVSGFPFFMMISGMGGVIFGIVWNKITNDKIFPFAPVLAISFFICLLLKDKLNYTDLILSIF